jgi:hypothetical protein
LLVVEWDTMGLLLESMGGPMSEWSLGGEGRKEGGREPSRGTVQAHGPSL